MASAPRVEGYRTQAADTDPDAERWLFDRPGSPPGARGIVTDLDRIGTRCPSESLARKP